MDEYSKKFDAKYSEYIKECQKICDKYKVLPPILVGITNTKEYRKYQLKQKTLEQVAIQELRKKNVFVSEYVLVKSGYSDKLINL